MSALASTASSPDPNRLCRLASSDIFSFAQPLCCGGFVKQYIERRNGSIPFDQRRNRAQSTTGNPVKTPDWRGYAATMIIYQHFRGGRMAGKMDFANAFRRKPIQRRNRIESVVHGIDE